MRATSLANGFERFLQHCHQELLALHVAQTASGVVVLHFLKGCIIGGESRNLLICCKGVKIGEDGAAASRLTRFSIDFGDDEATGIVPIENGPWTMDNSAGAWYDLQGRKLQGKPTRSGVYVKDGRKVVLK